MPNPVPGSPIASLRLLRLVHLKGNPWFETKRKSWSWNEDTKLGAEKEGDHGELPCEEGHVLRRKADGENFPEAACGDHLKGLPELTLPTAEK